MTLPCLPYIFNLPISNVFIFFRGSGAWCLGAKILEQIADLDLRPCDFTLGQVNFSVPQLPAVSVEMGMVMMKSHGMGMGRITQVLYI